ncbi:two-component system response regulator [Microvirga sp. 17 mud 1-3]|nr:two-component system response regulator [Microvirga sp. 17 mud 1-3]
MQGDVLMADAPVAFEDRADKSLLIVDDDRPFSTRLARAMEGRGYQVRVAESVAEGIAAIESEAPAFAVIDMRLGDGNGLDVIERLKNRRPDARGVILTGYGNIATAVTAVKMGAFDYLAKPADADEIHAALMARPGERATPPENPMSADRVRWEHIQRVYELCGRNVSETARRLNMHRRTLQRILAKRAPR